MVKMLYPPTRVRSGDFDVNDKERSGRPKEKDEELQALLDKDSAQSTCQFIYPGN